MRVEWLQEANVLNWGVETDPKRLQVRSFVCCGGNGEETCQRVNISDTVVVRTKLVFV